MSGTTPRILLVDADDDRMKPLAGRIEGLGSHVMVAVGGLYALTLLERERPNLVLTRALLGDMSGAELCGLVKRDPQLAGVRMVLLAHTLDEKVSAELAGEFDLVLLDDRPLPVLADSLQRLAGQEENQVLPPLPPRLAPPEPTARDQAIAGTLGVLSFAELTQALSQTGKTGRLLLETDDEPAVVLFGDGRVRHASFRRTRGAAAFTGLFYETERQRDTPFRFEPMSAGHMAEEPQTLDATAQHLLLQAAVELDQFTTTEIPTLSRDELERYDSPRSEYGGDKDPSSSHSS